MDSVVGVPEFRRADFLSLNFIADAEEGGDGMIARQVLLTDGVGRLGRGRQTGARKAASRAGAPHNRFAVGRSAGPSARRMPAKGSRARLPKDNGTRLQGQTSPLPSM